MSADDDLAREALARELARARNADEAFSEGVKAGLARQMAMAEETAVADRWDRVLKTVERIVDKVLSARDAAALRTAADKVKPPAAEDDGDALDAESILRAITSKRPASEVVPVLVEAGVTRANVDAVLSHVRSRDGWAAWLDANADYMTSLVDALPVDEAA